MKCSAGGSAHEMGQIGAHILYPSGSMIYINMVATAAPTFCVICTAIVVGKNIKVNICWNMMTF